MKISIFSTFYPFRGGIAQFNAMLFRALEKKHEVKAFTFVRQYPNFLFPGTTQFVTEEDQVDNIPAQQILDSMNPLSYLATAKAINKFNSTIYISNYWMTFFGPALGIISRFISKKTKQIAILHNVIPHEKKFYDKLFTNYFLKKTDGFVVMSDSVLKDLLELKPTANYIRIDHPIYSHFGEALPQETAQLQLGLDPTKKTLLFFGFIRDYKGLDLLIDALDQLDDTYQLIIAGEVYGSFDKYQQQIQLSSARNRIYLFNHYISDDQVNSYFSAADVCVLPYKSATQSGITAIAHHFEIPLIATDVGGLKETINHKKNGLIVNQTTASAIARCIQEYFTMELKTPFSAAIREGNKSKSWDHFAAKLVEFAESLPVER